jgi:hypothetical protein
MSKALTERETFDTFMRKLVSVPHSEIKRRLDAHKEASAKNPNRRGPKRKVKASAAPDPAEET